MPSLKTEATFLAMVCVCGIVLATGGCARKSVKAAAPVSAAPSPTPADSKPLTTIAPDTDATPPQENVPPPPNPVAATDVPLPVPPTHTKPLPPPRKPTSETPGDAQTEQPPKTRAPQISPQLSPGDQATLKRKTDDDIIVAKKNLQESSGRVLNAAQQDLVEKIQSFVNQSGEAGKAGDWARAQNLSQKARLLSAELVGSL